MESTLSLKLTDLQAKLGTYSGWGRGALYGDPAWSTTQQALLDDAVQSGLRRFYFPEPAEGHRESYCWSFLRPTVNLSLVSGAATLPLPDDFGGVEGNVTLQSSAGIAWGPVKVYNPGEVDVFYGRMPAKTGKPEMASVRWKPGTTPTAGQRAELYVWPLPDSAYGIRLQYYVLPGFLDAATAPYALGGMAHAETVLESCLAVLEERLDDTRGLHAAAFQGRLLASIAIDRKSKASTLGYNGDRSDDHDWHRGQNHAQNAISYNGTVY